MGATPLFPKHEAKGISSLKGPFTLSVSDRINVSYVKIMGTECYQWYLAKSLVLAMHNGK